MSFLCKLISVSAKGLRLILLKMFGNEMVIELKYCIAKNDFY